MTQPKKPLTTAGVSLEQVREQFDAWRKNKKSGSRIPMKLWRAAIDVSCQHSILEVSRELKLNFNDLKSRVQEAEEDRAYDPIRHAGFVEIPLCLPKDDSQWLVEMERPDGAKMKMHLGGHVDALALSKMFWSQGQ